MEKEKLFYKCYDCHQMVSSSIGEHYEIHYIKGMNDLHKSLVEITICPECFQRRIEKLRKR